MSKKNKKIKGDQWNLPDNVFDFDQDEINFFYAQAEKFLATLIAVSDSFQTRTTGLITVLVPVFFTSAGVAMSMFVGNINFALPLIIAAFLTAYAIIKCFLIIKSQISMREGSEPKKIIAEKWLTLSSEYRMKNIVLNECRDYQARIDERMKRNTQMGNNLNDAIKIIIATPLVALILYFFLLFL